MKNIMKQLSDKIVSNEADNRKEKRVSVLKEMTVLLILDNEEELPIVNISLNGVAFEGKPGIFYGVGDRVNGSLNVNGHHFHIEAHIRHYDKEAHIVGCSVENSDSNYMNRFLNEYKNDLEINTNKMGNIERAGDPYWFFNSSFELYFIVRNEKLIKVQIVNDREVLEFNQGKVFFGLADEKMDRNHVYYEGIDMVKQKRKIPMDFAKEAIDFINTIPDIQETHKKDLVKKLKKSVM